MSTPPTENADSYKIFGLTSLQRDPSFLKVRNVDCKSYTREETLAFPIKPNRTSLNDEAHNLLRYN